MYFHISLFYNRAHNLQSMQNNACNIDLKVLFVNIIANVFTVTKKQHFKVDIAFICCVPGRSRLLVFPSPRGFILNQLTVASPRKTSRMASV